MRWFEASLRRATPKGQDPSSPAQHRIKDPSYIGPSLRSGHTLAPHRRLTTAVRLFLAGKITFGEITRRIARATERHALLACPDFDELLAVDRWAREVAGAGS